MNEKQEKLLDFLNAQGEHTKEYQSHKDNIDNVACAMLECPEWYFDNIDNEEDKEVFKKLTENLGASDISEYLSFELTHGIHSRSNEVLSWNVGEVECQLTGLYDHETKSDCILSDLTKGMSKVEILETSNACEYYADIKCEYLYVDMSYDRFSAILDIDKLNNKEEN